MNDQTSSTEVTLMGDWIILARHKGQNYYLDLTTHEEAEGSARSERLMQEFRAGSQAEFPFLFDDRLD